MNLTRYQWLGWLVFAVLLITLAVLVVSHQVGSNKTAIMRTAIRSDMLAIYRDSGGTQSTPETVFASANRLRGEDKLSSIFDGDHLLFAYERRSDKLVPILIYSFGKRADSAEVILIMEVSGP